eukprot:14006190-Alexandrium_andersonii.AAC.1
MATMNGYDASLFAMRCNPLAKRNCAITWVVAWVRHENNDDRAWNPNMATLKDCSRTPADIN